MLFVSNSKAPEIDALMVGVPDHAPSKANCLVVSAPDKLRKVVSRRGRRSPLSRGHAARASFAASTGYPSRSVLRESAVRARESLAMALHGLRVSIQFFFLSYSSLLLRFCFLLLRYQRLLSRNLCLRGRR